MFFVADQILTIADTVHSHINSLAELLEVKGLSVNLRTVIVVGPVVPTTISQIDGGSILIEKSTS